jgi:hypothetical protein
MTRQSYWFYAPIVMVLGIAYLIGGALAFGVHFLGWFAMLTEQTPRLILALFGMGMLGATSYSVRWWAKDMEEALRDPALLPHAFDAFGYAATIVGGGITGVMLYLVARGAAAVAVDSVSPPMLRPSVAFVLAFCGGLFEFKVEALLQKDVTEVGKRAGNV